MKKKNKCKNKCSQHQKQKQYNCNGNNNNLMNKKSRIKYENNNRIQLTNKNKLNRSNKLSLSTMKISLNGQHKDQNLDQNKLTLIDNNKAPFTSCQNHFNNFRVLQSLTKRPLVKSQTCINETDEHNKNRQTQSQQQRIQQIYKGIKMIHSTYGYFTKIKQQKDSFDMDEEQKRQLYYGNTTTSNHTKKDQRINNQGRKYTQLESTKEINQCKKIYKKSKSKSNSKVNSKSKSKDSKHNINSNINNINMNYNSNQLIKTINTNKNKKSQKNSHQNANKISKTSLSRKYESIQKQTTSHRQQHQTYPQTLGSIRLFQSIHKADSKQKQKPAIINTSHYSFHHLSLQSLQHQLQSKQCLYNTIKTRNMLQSMDKLQENLKQWEYKRLKKIHQAEEQMLDDQIIKLKKIIKNKQEENYIFVDSNQHVISYIDIKNC